MSTLKTETIYIQDPTFTNKPGNNNSNGWPTYSFEDIQQVIIGGGGGTNTSNTGTWVTSHNATITPMNSENYILIFCNFMGRINGGSTRMLGRIQRVVSGGSTTTIWQHNSVSINASNPQHQGFMIFDAPSTTAAVTYNFDILSSDGGTVYTADTGGNNAGNPNTLVLIEIQNRVA